VLPSEAAVVVVSRGGGGVKSTNDGNFKNIDLDHGSP
jgi:hypothetical protein